MYLSFLKSSFSLSPIEVSSINMFLLYLPSRFTFWMSILYLLNHLEFTEVRGNHIISFTPKAYSMVEWRKNIITLYFRLRSIFTYFSWLQQKRVGAKSLMKGWWFLICLWLAILEVRYLTLDCIILKTHRVLFLRCNTHLLLDSFS